MKKKILSAALAIVMVLSMFTFAAVAEVTTTTVKYDANWGNPVGFFNYLNAINVQSDKVAEWTSLTEYKNFLGILQDIWLGKFGYSPVVDINDAAAFDAAFRAYDMANLGLAGVNAWDYMQNEFGKVAYQFDGGKKLAYDLWNANVKYPVVDNGAAYSYTYTNASAQKAYTEASYQTAIDALNLYLAYANENWAFNADSESRWNNQKTRFEALETAIANLEEVAAPEIPDLSGLNVGGRAQIFIDWYNAIDVYEYQIKPEHIAYGNAILKAVNDGLDVDVTVIDELGMSVCSYFEQVWRKVMGVNTFVKNHADAVWNDESIWPAGKPAEDLEQTRYAYNAYLAARNQWVKIRDEMRGSNFKLSEVLAECQTLSEMIQTLPGAGVVTAEQQQAVANLKTYLPHYQARLARVTLAENLELPIVVEFARLVALGESYLDHDWSDFSTEENLPTADEMWALISKDVIDTCLLEPAWLEMRVAVGLDYRGVDSKSSSIWYEWQASGKYTEESLQAAWNLRAEYLEGGHEIWGSATDAEFVDMMADMESVLELKPAKEGFYDVTEYKANGTAPTAEGKVFGGWYTDETCTTPYMETTGEAYAKFVDANVLRTAFQLKGGTTADSASTDMRLITTVDRLDYKEVGFTVKVGSSTRVFKTTSVFRTIYANGASLSYKPSMFSSESIAFLTVTFANIPNRGFGSDISVTPFWVTADGTTVEGATTTKTVSGMIK